MDTGNEMLNHSTKIISRLATENGRLRFLIGEAITYMSHADTFIGSREKMHLEGRTQWRELIGRMRDALADCKREDQRFLSEVFGDDAPPNPCTCTDETQCEYCRKLNAEQFPLDAQNMSEPRK